MPANASTNRQHCAEVDDPVGMGHHRLVVIDHGQQLAGVDEPVERAEQLFHVGQVKPARR